MDEKLTPEQADKLLKAIFTEDDQSDDDMPDDYPDTDLEKVGYAEYVLAADLEYIGKAINRLSRLYGRLKVTEKDENGLPPIIFQNELRMALEPLLRVRGGVNEITDTLLKIYREQKRLVDGIV